MPAGTVDRTRRESALLAQTGRWRGHSMSAPPVISEVNLFRFRQSVVYVDAEHDIVEHLKRHPDYGIYIRLAAASARMQPS
jgi:hypothetical protein